jgi:transcriptional regulator with XRE-family HTH domain
MTPATPSAARAALRKWAKSRASQNAAARELGVLNSTLSRILNDGKMPSGETAALIESRAGIPLRAWFPMRRAA